VDHHQRLMKVALGVTLSHLCCNLEDYQIIVDRVGSVQIFQDTFYLFLLAIQWWYVRRTGGKKSKFGC